MTFKNIDFIFIQLRASLIMSVFFLVAILVTNTSNINFLTHDLYLWTLITVALEVVFPFLNIFTCVDLHMISSVFYKIVNKKYNFFV